MRHEVLLSEIPCATESFLTEIISKSQNPSWLALPVPGAPYLNTDRHFCKSIMDGGAAGGSGARELSARSPAACLAAIHACMLIDDKTLIHAAAPCLGWPPAPVRHSIAPRAKYGMKC